MPTLALYIHWIRVTVSRSAVDIADAQRAFPSRLWFSIDGDTLRMVLFPVTLVGPFLRVIFFSTLDGAAACFEETAALVAPVSTGLGWAWRPSVESLCSGISSLTRA